MAERRGASCDLHRVEADDPNPVALERSASGGPQPNLQHASAVQVDQQLGREVDRSAGVLEVQKHIHPGPTGFMRTRAAA